PTPAGFRLHPALAGGYCPVLPRGQRRGPARHRGRRGYPMTSTPEAALLQALAAAPEDELAWQALADVREEQGDPSGHLLRLQLGVRRHWQAPGRDLWRQEMARLLGAGVKFDLPRLRNGLGMELALIPPGAFLMGSPHDEADREDDEHLHEVEITR